MKKILLILLSVSLVPNFAGADTVFQKINFADSDTENEIIIVAKTEAFRTFYRCPSHLAAVDKAQCKFLEQIGVQKYEIEKQYINPDYFVRWSYPKLVGSVVGIVAGVFTGGFLAGSLEKKVGLSNGKAVLVFFIGWGLTTSFGYIIGDYFDGEEFLATEKTAILGTIGQKEILDLSYTEQITLKLDINSFSWKLTKATKAIYTRNLK